MLKEIIESINEKENDYKKFFDSVLKKYGVKSPNELSSADKRKFYDEIDKGWDAGDNETD